MRERVEREERRGEEERSARKREERVGGGCEGGRMGEEREEGGCEGEGGEGGEKRVWKGGGGRGEGQGARYTGMFS